MVGSQQIRSGSPPTPCALLAALDDYTIMPLETDTLVSSWVKLRSATIAGAPSDDRERRQNDTWTAASALSADPPLPVASGNAGSPQRLRVYGGHSQRLRPFDLRPFLP
jgi:hypothetical protein